MAVNIPQVPPYTGEIALRTDPVNFPKNAEDQYTYLATLSEDVNAFSDAVNDIGDEFNDLADITRLNADEAKASEDAALVSEDAASDSASSSSSSAGSSLASANASATSAIESSDFADDSAGSAQQSASSAAESKLYRDQAEEISGLDTVEEAVEVAISALNLGVLSEAESSGIRAQNNHRLAASGQVRTGKHGENKIVNGLYVDLATPDTILMGGGTLGDSETVFAQSHIAGVISDLVNINTTNADTASILLPPAERGVRTFNSATGEILDFSVDVDAKYNDVAADTNEAIARAFEGDVRNGDFRFSDDGNWRKSGAVITPSLAVLTKTTESSVRIFQNTYSGYLGLNVEYMLEATFVADAGLLVGLEYYKNGSTNNYVVATGKQQTVKLRATMEPDAEFSFYIRPSGQMGSCTVYSISVRPSTDEVVTERVDVWGFEQWQEEVVDGEVFDCIQSEVATFGDTDVPTVLSTRPLSYFQVYDGQFENPSAINDRYRCVDWNSITDEQKVKVSSYLREKLFVGKDGLLINTRVRQRSIAGAGNGNWVSVNPATGVDFSYSAKAYPRAQGSDDTCQRYTDSVFPTSSLYRSKGYVDGNVNPNLPDISIYGAGISGGTTLGYGGECYFTVGGTVSRLNQGAFHPSLNRMGCSKFRNSFNDNAADWNSTILDLSGQATKDMFYSGADIANHRTDESGYIGSDKGSGRPDDRLYDAVYTGGQGGAISLLLPADDSSSTEVASSVRVLVESGEYGGLERLAKTYIVDLGSPFLEWNATNVIIGQNNSDITVALKSWINYELTAFLSYILCGSTRTYLLNNYIDQYLVCKVGAATNLYKINQGTFADNVKLVPMHGSPDITESFTPDSAYMAFTVNDASGIGYNVPTKASSITASGEFMHQDAFGDPAELLQTYIFMEGWVGSWIPQIPDGDGVNPEEVVLTRKSTKPITFENTPVSVSQDNGEAWASGGLTGDSVTNSTGMVAAVPGSVAIINYTAYAKQTELIASAPVLHGELGLLGVVTTQDYGKAIYTESVAGIITKSDASGIITESSKALKVLIDGEIERIKTQLTDMTSPVNGSQAVKVAIYQVDNNSRMYLYFIANTMTHNGTDWGEDDEMTLTAGPFTDLNGTTQLCSITRTILPYGWMRNKI